MQDFMTEWKLRERLRDLWGNRSGPIMRLYWDEACIDMRFCRIYNDIISFYAQENLWGAMKI